MRILRPLVLALFSTLPLLPLHAQSSAPANPIPAVAAGPVSVVVFSDFECPYSSQLFFTLQKLQARYPKQLHVTYKQSPLVDTHPDAPLAHRAALAAARQGRYTAMAELLYANQKPQTVASLTAFARQLHLDPIRFRRDLNSASVTAELNADMEESRAFGIEQTPTLYVNGKALVGYQPEESLIALIDKAGADKAIAAAQLASAGKPLDPALLGEMQASPIASQGQAAAPLTIIEFTDFQCPFCRAAVAPMEQFMAARGHEVRWIIRAFPLDFHLDSELATEAALAAGEQGKFWQMHDLLFANQSALKADNLRTYAQQLHLDMHAFDEALATHRFAGQIAADRLLGARAGVDATPTFIVDGREMTGSLSLPELNQLADTHSIRGGVAPAIVAVVPVLPAESPDQQVMGPPASVPLTVTWFADVRSSLITRQADLLRDLSAQYNGRMRVLFRAFPIESHPDSRISSAALLAALKQGKFWPMFDALAERHDLLDRAKLLSIAGALGLKQDAFATDLDASTAAVMANLDEATRRGIQGAPVLFLNKERVDGLQRKEFYTAILDRQLKESPSQAALVP